MTIIFFTANAEEAEMNEDFSVITTQLDFFRQGKAGCVFAAYVAGNPLKYGWIHKILNVDACAIDAEIAQAIDLPEVTTLSLIFPDVDSLEGIIELIRVMTKCKYILLEQDVILDDSRSRCLGFRVRVDQLLSWVSGFGHFDCFPKTRQTVYTEIIFRVKPRPNYARVMKKSPPSVIHLADMDMLGIADVIFKKMWYDSLDRTQQLLGHTPDLRSAAKTTFTLPSNILI
ncbi:hypothetical protein [Argonema antarcticum]|uniref:hypothetical protein n=1 Tax=Argonema antarcticum TaxID=2942763 RepID=UPI002011835E|nr:hypothetical protein [Argonema antarcticum]MCL1473388.1 hypothetical protein [Argonema antarcticum A004/B2]